MTRDTYFRGGDWHPPAGSGTFDVYEPYSGKVFAKVAACEQADAVLAVDAAAEAFEEWASLPPARKAALFLRAEEIVAKRRDELVDLLVHETGCTTMLAMLQQDLVQQFLRHAAGWVYQPKGEVLQSDVPGVSSTTVRRPLGVVACISPWNAASILGWQAALQPLAAGNTVVLKPSELAPVSAGLVIAEVADEAGFPPGVVNVVPHAPGAAPAIADVFFNDDRVRCINFIGSVETGRMLSERAGRALKRTVMELGGHNPMIVLDDADLDYAVRSAMFSAFLHQGQICMAARMILVQRGLHDAFVRKFVEKTAELRRGDPRDPATFIGPLINQAALDKVHRRVTDAVALGARVLTGGTYDGLIYEPTVLADVPLEAEMATVETFGPVVAVAPFDTVDEAIELANRSHYGLSSAVFTADAGRGLEVGARVKSGAVHVNGPTIDQELQAPFGGVSDSGWGRSGPQSVNDFTDLVWVTVQSGQRPLPF
ncbi:aldehyde dehydrogenase family protein [Lentzea sp. BCCO 10_0061]|uniref:Aldehyde dehydrogenase family protein n=1 Tax=Lentzea sokolovensis TaxID=3095429 RepID=A0ABU4VDH2_9PSEU|nr:aldehyde dehydrogenase family protein [Lentzea sp. BCCO 10_0061]MDX8149490.1 aldehyde dehydrogenase family protein [Lentzea sp. BCCO 10_0061]